MGGVPALELADQPTVVGLLDTELISEKRDKGQELVRSLTDEQRARLGQLLADNPLPGPSRVGERVGPMSPAEMSKPRIEAMKALLPEMESWKETISSGLAGILTPEQYQLYQDSLLPTPAQLADIGPQSYDDCDSANVYAYYANTYAYYGYLYAYYSYANYESLLSYDIYVLAVDTYVYSYYGYLYAYYAVVYYYDYTYSFYSYYYNVNAMVIAYWTSGFSYDVYNLSGGTYAYYAYLYDYYAYLYDYYAYVYSYYCFVGG
jgi:hypothetical protein